MSPRPYLAIIALTALAGCGQPQPETKAPTVAAVPPVTVQVPAGRYTLDPAHAVLQFSILHSGLSHYTAPFGKYQGVIDLDPQRVENSTVTFTVDVPSVRTGLDPIGYKAFHKASRYNSWDEELGLDATFLGGEANPQARFVSTQVQSAGPGRARVTGDLSFHGVTKPVTFDVVLNGQLPKHPFSKAPAVGFHAEGEISRAAFGVAGRGLLGDQVKLVFDGEFGMAPVGGPPAPPKD